MSEALKAGHRVVATAHHREARLEYGPATLNDPDQNYDDRENEKNMNESPQSVGSNQSQQP